MTRDAFLGGRLMVAQPAKGYRAGLDAVLLAAAAPVRSGDCVVDLGAGVGTVGLCIAARVADIRLVLIERDPATAAMAMQNVADNGWAERTHVIEGDVTAPLGRAGPMAAHLGRADVVVANPPYADPTSGSRSANALRDAAHVMAAEALDDWVRAMAAFGTAGAIGLMIHRADALLAVLAAFDRRFGAITILPVAPAAGAAANRIIVSGRKGNGAPLRLLPPLIVHGEDDRYRPEVDAIVRGGGALTVS